MRGRSLPDTGEAHPSRVVSHVEPNVTVPRCGVRGVRRSCVHPPVHSDRLVRTVLRRDDLGRDAGRRTNHCPNWVPAVLSEDLVSVTPPEKPVTPSGTLEAVPKARGHHHGTPAVTSVSTRVTMIPALNSRDHAMRPIIREPFSCSSSSLGERVTISSPLGTKLIMKCLLYLPTRACRSIRSGLIRHCARQMLRYPGHRGVIFHRRRPRLVGPAKSAFQARSRRSRRSPGSDRVSGRTPVWWT